MRRKKKTILSATLRTLRAQRGMSLRRVESETGISNAYLSQLESGYTTSPSPHVLAKLARAYGVDDSDLMIAAGYVERPAKPDNLSSFLAGSGLSEIELRRVTDYVRRLIRNRHKKELE